MDDIFFFVRVCLMVWLIIGRKLQMVESIKVFHEWSFAKEKEIALCTNATKN
jgi:hypothetical protein